MHPETAQGAGDTPGREADRLYPVGLTLESGDRQQAGRRGWLEEGPLFPGESPPREQSLGEELKVRKRG